MTKQATTAVNNRNHFMTAVTPSGENCLSFVASDAGSRIYVTDSSRSQTAERMRINRDRMTSYLISHGEYARPFQGSFADSRMYVQQAKFEE